MKKRSLRITNETKWKTADLRRILSTCLSEVIRREGRRPELTNQRVRIKYSRSGWVTGRGMYNEGWVQLNLPSSLDRLKSAVLYPLDPVTDYDRTITLIWEIANVYIHELGHNLGVRHPGRRGSGDPLIERRPLTIEKMFLEWIRATFSDESYSIAFDEPKQKKTIDIRQVRYERAKKNLATAETRLKRARTLFKKWNTKVRYYEKTFAEAASSAGGDHVKD